MMDKDCLFCKIIGGEVPSVKVYEDEKVLAFKDVAPMAKIHVLFVHKEHTANLNDMTKNAPSQMADVMRAICKYTEDSDLVTSGYRVVTNVGPDAGQTILHTHFHLLSGGRLKKFGA